MNKPLASSLAAAVSFCPYPVSLFPSQNDPDKEYNMPKDGTVHELTSNVRGDDLNHSLRRTASEEGLKRAVEKCLKLPWYWKGN